MRTWRCRTAVKLRGISRLPAVGSKASIVDDDPAQGDDALDQGVREQHGPEDRQSQSRERDDEQQRFRRQTDRGRSGAHEPVLQSQAG